MAKVGGNEKHIKYVKTRKFAENRGKFIKVGGKNNFVEIEGKIRNFWLMTKKAIRNFGVKNVKFGKFSTESEFFSETEGGI